VFWRIRLRWTTTDAWEFKATPPWAIAYDRSLDKAFRVKVGATLAGRAAAATSLDRVDEAISATRKTRA
jgi:hypothetical protein